VHEQAAVPHHAGDLSPAQAFERLRDDPSAVLVDVRTRAEWTYVGVPDLRALGKEVVTLEWQTFPDGVVNAGFLPALRRAGIRPGTPLLFLCRSGARSASAAAAATADGMGPAYNVSEGFEGTPDSAGHRGSVSGWKVAGLPWRQS
jgi:rhodanese-related sulfurtransferase